MSNVLYVQNLERQLATQTAQAAQIAVMREALEGVLPWVVTQSVACNGLKCREAVCISCTGEDEAESAAQQACIASNNAFKALAATPADAIASVIERVKEQCAAVCESIAHDWRFDIPAQSEECAKAIRALEIKL